MVKDFCLVLSLIAPQNGLHGVTLNTNRLNTGSIVSRGRDIMGTDYNCMWQGKGVHVYMFARESCLHSVLRKQMFKRWRRGCVTSGWLYFEVHSRIQLSRTQTQFCSISMTCDQPALTCFHLHTSVRNLAEFGEFYQIDCVWLNGEITFKNESGWPMYISLW